MYVTYFIFICRQKNFGKDNWCLFVCVETFENITIYSPGAYLWSHKITTHGEKVYLIGIYSYSHIVKDDNESKCKYFRQ